jgi:Tol biopolymer transport system component
MKWVLFILIIAIIAGCAPSTNSSCVQLYPYDAVIEPTYYFDDNTDHYYSPVFNPNNSNEIMYLKKYVITGSTSTISLETFNYVTEEHHIILSDTDMVNNNLGFWKYNWSSAGWVALENDYNFQIYKMRDDGTLLQQLTSDGNSFYPFFNYTGDKLFFTNNSSTYSQSFGILMDINTNTFLDSITFGNGLIGSYGLGTGLSNNTIAL